VGYRYAHDEPDAYAAGEHYVPEYIPEQRWYQPVPRGLETRIGDKLDHLRELNEQACKSEKGQDAHCALEKSLGAVASRVEKT